MYNVNTMHGTAKDLEQDDFMLLHVNGFTSKKIHFFNRDVFKTKYCVFCSSVKDKWCNRLLPTT